MRHFSLPLAGALALALVLVPAPSAFAEEVTGTIVSIDDRTLQLRSEDGRQLRIELAPDARVQGADRGDMQASDLAPGDRIAVDYDSSDPKRLVTDVQIHEDGPAGTPMQRETRTDGDAQPMADDRQGSAADRADRTATGFGEDAAAAGQRTQTTRRELPDSASPLPLIAVAGGLVLAGAVLVRIARRR